MIVIPRKNPDPGLSHSMPTQTILSWSHLTTCFAWNAAHQRIGDLGGPGYQREIVIVSIARLYAFLECARPRCAYNLYYVKSAPEEGIPLLPHVGLQKVGPKFCRKLDCPVFKAYDTRCAAGWRSRRFGNRLVANPDGESIALQRNASYTFRHHSENQGLSLACERFR
jgi:hypothetical protein